MSTVPSEYIAPMNIGASMPRYERHDALSTDRITKLEGSITP